MFDIFKFVFLWVCKKNDFSCKDPDPRWLDVHAQIGVQDFVRRMMGITKLS